MTKANKEQAVLPMLPCNPSFRKAQLSPKGLTKASIDFLLANTSAPCSDLSPAFKRFDQVTLGAFVWLPQLYFSFFVFNLSYKVLRDLHSLSSIFCAFRKYLFCHLFFPPCASPLKNLTINKISSTFSVLMIHQYFSFRFVIFFLS